MQSSGIGLEAPGLCLEPLLQHGIPSTEVIESMIHEIDDNLLHNNRRLEECVSEIFSMANEMNNDEFFDPIDALDVMLDNRRLENTTCHDLDAGHTYHILKQLMILLEKYPGHETKLLDEFLLLSSTQGLSIPQKLASLSTDTAESRLSINTITDQSEVDVENLWNNICSKFRTHCMQVLSLLPVGKQISPINQNTENRLKCVQGLCALYTSDVVWSLYQTLRVRQFESTFEFSETGSGGGFLIAVKNLEKTSLSAMIMMQEDFELLNSAIFQGANITTFKALHSIYLERIADEVSTILEEMKNDLMALQAKGKEMHKSSSEFVKLGNARGQLKRTHSKSLEHLHTPYDSATAEFDTLPKSYMLALVKLVNCILGLDSCVDQLHSSTVWELPSRRATRKASHMKSVLKPTADMPTDGEVPKPPRSEYKRPFSMRSFESSGIFPEDIPPPFGALDDAMPYSGSPPEVVEKLEHEERPEWDWLPHFRSIVGGVAKGVEVIFREAAKNTQQALSRTSIQDDILEVINLPANLVGGRLDYPKVIFKDVYDLLEIMENLLPLAVAGGRGCLQVVRSTYVDTIMLCLKDVSMSLARVGKEAGIKEPLKSLYLVMSSAAFIRNQLLYLDDILSSEDISKKRFGVLYRQYCEQVDAMTRQIVEYQNQVLIESVLHDAESHDWENSKAFYENERCSFYLQMWYYHMLGLQYDLWHFCPPKLGQTVFSTVLHDSLSILCGQYTRVKPTYKRTQQFKSDITFILLAVAEFMYPASSNIGRYLDASMVQHPNFAIHNLCITLLSTLAVITSPLDVLYKVFKKGFNHHKKKSREDKRIKGHSSNWLSWIRPQIIPHGKVGSFSLQSSSMVYMNVKLLITQPDPNWTILLQTLLMRNNTLSIMLLTKTAENVAEIYSQSSANLTESGRQATITSAGLVFDAFIDILLQCSDFPASLASCIIPVINRTDGWELLDEKSVLGKTHHVPLWMRSVFKALEKFMIRIINPAVRVLLQQKTESAECEQLVDNLSKLPCGCMIKQRRMSSQVDVPLDAMSQALYSLVTQLVTDIYSLPASLVMLFKELDERKAERKGSKTKQSDMCVGIKLLATCLRLTVSDSAYISHLIGAPISMSLKDNLIMLAECVYHILIDSDQQYGLSTPRLAAQFMKTSRNWLKEQIEILTDHFSNDNFALPDSSEYEKASVEFMENYYVTNISTILSSETGLQSLHKIYNFIMHNSSWILAQLDVPPLMPSRDTDQAPGSQLFVISAAPIDDRPFQPLDAYCMLGDSRLDQVKLAEWPFDWLPLLQSDLGLTEAGFCKLLYNRHEFQDGAYLDDAEVKPVQVLRSKFNMGSTDAI